MAIIVISLFSLASCGDNRNSSLLEGGHFNEPIGIDGFGPPPAPTTSHCGNLVMAVSEPNGVGVRHIPYVTWIQGDGRVPEEFIVYVVPPNGNEYVLGVKVSDVLTIRQMEPGEH